MSQASKVRTDRGRFVPDDDSTPFGVEDLGEGSGMPDEFDLGPGSDIPGLSKDLGAADNMPPPDVQEGDNLGAVGPGAPMPEQDPQEWANHFGVDDEAPHDDESDRLKQEPEDVRQDVADALDHEHISPDALDSPQGHSPDRDIPTSPDAVVDAEDEQTPEQPDDAEFDTKGDGDGDINSQMAKAEADSTGMEDNVADPENADTSGRNFYGNVLGVVRNVEKQMDRAASSVHPLISDTEKILHHSKRYHQSLGQLEGGLESFSLGVKSFRTVTADRHRKQTDELRAGVSRGLQEGMAMLPN